MGAKEASHPGEEVAEAVRRMGSAGWLQGTEGGGEKGVACSLEEGSRVSLGNILETLGRARVLLEVKWEGAIGGVSAARGPCVPFRCTLCPSVKGLERRPRLTINIQRATLWL